MTALNRILNILAVLLGLSLFLYLVLHREAFFWDFRVYYRAAQLFVHGQDPYADEFQVTMGYSVGHLPFVYPPLTLFLFAPFTLLPESAAALVWLGLKLLALGYLLRLWKKRYFDFPIDWRFKLFLLLAFNTTIYTDLATGNFAVFEALILYLAADKLLRGKDGWAVGLIVAIAAIKMTPLVFLALVLGFGGPQRVRTVLAGGLAFALYLAANMLAFGKYTTEFLQVAATRDEIRENNPTLYTYAKDLGIRFAHISALPVYLVLAGAVLWITVKTLRQHRPSPIMGLLFAWLALAMILPRFMIYSFIQLLPMGWIALKQVQGLARWALAAALGVLIPGNYLWVPKPVIRGYLQNLLGMQPSCWGYAALYATLAVWGVFAMRVIPADAKRSP